MSEATEVVVRDPPNGGLPQVRTETEPVSYQGASMLALTAEEMQVLAEPVPENEIDLKPTGEIYASHRIYRQRFNRAFGAGQWALIPRGPYRVEEGYVIREFALFVRGCFVTEAIGGCQYHATNDKMSWDDACEGARSNALSRCGKDLGIALELWDRLHADSLRDKIGVRVWRQPGKKPEWRRIEAKPFWDEKGITDDSPNQDRYQQPQGGAPPQGAPRAPAGDGRTQNPSPPAASPGKPLTVNPDKLREVVSKSPAKGNVDLAKAHTLILLSAWPEMEHNKVIAMASPMNEEKTDRVVKTRDAFLSDATSNEVALQIYTGIHKAAVAFIAKLDAQKKAA